MPVVQNYNDVCKYLVKLENWKTCHGNLDQKYQSLLKEGFPAVDSNNGLSAYKEGEFGLECDGVRFHSTIRSTKCMLLIKGGRCPACRCYRYTLNTILRRKTEKENRPQTQAAPQLSRKRHIDMNAKEVSKKVQALHQFNRSLKQHNSELMVENERLKREINDKIRKEGSGFSAVDSVDLLNMMEDASKSDDYKKCNDYQKLLIDQQLKYNQLKDARGMRWHPTIIKWCIYLRSKSPKGYKSLKETGFLTLPSERTLYDYSHCIKGGIGLQCDVLQQLANEIKQKKLFDDHQKYVGLLQDEMKIKSDLVYCKHSGELIGFVNLDEFGNAVNEFGDKDEGQQTLAKYILLFMVRGISSDLSYPLAHYATNGITADLLYPLIWQAIGALETDIGLKVLFITCDGASPNRRFFKLHGDNDCVFYTINPYSPDRNVYFISDVPHLLKTARNCYSNSHSHKLSRSLWRNGKTISWMHIIDLYDDHCSGIYRLCPKLSKAHVNLTSYSIMNVRLAAQVMSNTVANALEHSYGQNVSETVEFIRFMNRFFDILNVKNLSEGIRKRNGDLNPFRQGDDARLDWLLTDFLTYFEEWKNMVNIKAQNDDLSKSEKAKMLLSHQTLEGLEISTKSIVACVRYMLNVGAEYILTRVFNQDKIEQYFGMLRMRGGANDNPTMVQAGHLINQLRFVHTEQFENIRGNVEGGIDRVLDNVPMPRRQKDN